MDELQKITTFEEDISIIKDATTKVFLVTGKILQGIQDGKKYKEAGYKTFAEAVKVELGLKKTQAYCLIDAATVYENLSASGGHFLPTSERQLRPMLKLTAPEQIEVWQEVAKDKVPTTREVQIAVNKRLGKVLNVKSSIKNSTTIDTTKYITIEEHNTIISAYEKACTEDSERLMKKVHELEEQLRLLKESCVAPAEILIEKAVSTLIPRQLVFEFIQKNGTEFQVMALKDESLPNEKLWKVFLKVREQYKASTPPPAWDKVIVNATGIE